MILALILKQNIMIPVITQQLKKRDDSPLKSRIIAGHRYHFPKTEEQRRLHDPLILEVSVGLIKFVVKIISSKESMKVGEHIP